MANSHLKKVSRAAELLSAHASSFPEDTKLPWWKKPTPYYVFVAEFLLVRTRTDVVARVFDAVVDKYPDFVSLGKAKEEYLAAILSPLGLPQRVPLLLRASKYIVENENGELPQTIQELKAVPGLGDYTAGAVAAFAFGIPNVPADVNILRFVSRLTGLPMEHQTKGSRNLKELLPMLSRERGGPQLRVVLDFTRLICRPRKPLCSQCPLTRNCSYFRSDSANK